jgi:hypothetical protein
VRGHSLSRNTFSTGESYVDSTPPTYGSLAFLGFTSTTATTSFTIKYANIANEQLIFDDFKFGTAIPEPSSLVMLGVGVLFALGWKGYRNAKKAVHLC